MGYFPRELYTKHIMGIESDFRHELTEDFVFLSAFRPVDILITNEFWRGFPQVVNHFWNITTPEGFRTDFRSTPFGRKSGRWDEATVVHDYLCVLSNSITNKVQAKAARQYADKVYVEALKALGCSRWRQIIDGMGVRAFTTGKYKGYRRHSKRFR